MYDKQEEMLNLEIVGTGISLKSARGNLNKQDTEAVEEFLKKDYEL